MSATTQGTQGRRSLTSVVGAWSLGEGRYRFRVWAPVAQSVEVHLLTSRTRLVPLAKRARGYHEAVIEGVEPGTLYRYRLDAALERPDPASRSQPEDVHGPSQVVDSHFDWSDGA